MQYVLALISFIAGSGLAYAGLRAWDNSRVNSVKKQISDMLKEAEDSSERVKQAKVAETREEVSRMRQEAQKDIKERRAEIQRTERKLEQKEDNLDKKIERVTRKEDELKSRHEELEKRKAVIDEAISQQEAKLQEIAAMTREEAQEVLIRRIEADARHFLGLRLKEIEEQFGREADRKARDIIISA
ncbi:MAG: DUF3552 domain-containing protein, partial [Synergistaceae bacterium]|nr:DUF3552 domain-containing protein [Synergistaceae bacterium]